ncbi:MAG: GNAT family acetyltransferase [Cohaesibacteraceae bacterium]|nr:GNAT family acetyltransferase [Cohaesibacteraceae bacterium]
MDPETLIFSTIAESDIPEIIALWKLCGLIRPWNDPDRDINMALSTASSTILAARKNSTAEIISSVMVGYDGHRGYVYYVCVHPDEQSKGYGRKVMQAATTWLLEQGVWKLQLLVRGSNLGVVEFYKSIGFDQSDCVLLEKWIDPDDPRKL